MSGIKTSAPGKAVVAGEYAVLNGAPAISMALDRRARVRVIDKANSAHSVSAPGYLAGSFRFRLESNGSFQWIDELPSGDVLALFEAVWRLSGLKKSSGLSFVLDTREFFDPGSGTKLGLGGSAALATALAAALIATGASSCTIDWLAAQAHREFQSGAGSGVDIATAIHGGLIDFQIDKPVKPLQWPDALAYRLLWSGHAASTVRKLGEISGQEHSAGGDRLGNASRDVTVAWQSGNAVRVLSEIALYTNELQTYSIDHGLGIFEAGHQELADMAKQHQKTVYKPCGAGGGDIGIVLAHSMKEVDLFTAAAGKSGFTPLDVSLDTDGVLVEGRSLC